MSSIQAADVQPTQHPIIQHSRVGAFFKLAETIFITPLTSVVSLSGRFVKLITWDAGHAAVLKVLGYHDEAASSFEMSYLKTVRVVRDILLIPDNARSAFNDMLAAPVEWDNSLKPMRTQDYLSVSHTKKFDQFSSYLYGRKTFEVVNPTGIREFAAESDGTLNTVMASHFLKPDVMAINFGIPNVATFLTEAKEDGSVQTVKIDAKSLKRDKMSYHGTNGKIQSGVFFVPTNLPQEALERFKAASKKLEGRADITCVNTNCRVLEKAGFTIEGKKMTETIFPTTLMEHFLFRNVIYTDSNGVRHKVHFEIINTTPHSLEEHYEKIDLAVVGTRLRHKRRNADTEENRKERGVAARALIQEEKKRIKEGAASHEVRHDLKTRKVSVSVSSSFGDFFARIWGRHTIYEVDLSDKKDEIANAFEGTKPLKPFPQENPSLVTRIKRDFLFSKPMINFLRRHIMGSTDTLYLETQDLFNHLKSTNGERLNYVVLGDKVVLAKVKASEVQEGARKIADWALSKHALIAGRESVHCSGELWYDKEKGRFMVNKDSGTYMPDSARLKKAVDLINTIFETKLGSAFAAAE